MSFKIKALLVLPIVLMICETAFFKSVLGNCGAIGLSAHKELAYGITLVVLTTLVLNYALIVGFIKVYNSIKHTRDSYKAKILSLHEEALVMNAMLDKYKGKKNG
jgi:hypothetical protein